MPQKTTIRDIASACGVAPSSVSRVLNNRAGEVGPETRQRILDTVRRMNYRPNQSLDVPSEVIHTLGIISSFSGASWEQSGYFHSLIDNLLRVISERHHNGLIYTAHIFDSEPQQSIRQYCDGRCDGLLLLAPFERTPLSSALLERGFPLVMIGTTVQDGSASYCDIDNVHGASLAVNEMLSAGHKRIALCQGPDGLQSTEIRRNVYLDLLKAHNIEVAPEFLSPPADKSEIIGDWAQSLMLDREIGSRPTGIVCFNDYHASYVVDRLIELGIRVPEDVSIVGYDDTCASVMVPPLTTIAQPYRELSQCAIEKLLAQIEDTRTSPSGQVIQGRLVRRLSVAPPPS